MKRIGRICGGAPSALCGCAFAWGAAGSIPSGAAARKKGKRHGVVQAERFRCADGFFISGARCKNGAGGLPRRWRMGTRRAGAVCRGMAARLRAAAGQDRQRTPNRRVEERQAGAEAEAAVPQKNRQSSARKALFRPPGRSADGFCRPSGKGHFYRFPVGAQNVSAVPRRRAWRNEPTVWKRRVRRFFV